MSAKKIPPNSPEESAGFADTTATELQGTPTPANFPLSSARTEQEQRNQQVRDINARIAGLEERIVDMAGSLASSREHVGTAFEKLERQVRQAETLLQKQEAQVGHLQSAQLELRGLYDELDFMRRQHGAAIDALALDTRRRFDETRQGLSLLHDIVQQHRATLTAYRQDHEQVARHVGAIQAQVHSMDTRLNARVDALEDDVQTRAAGLGVRIDGQANALRAHAESARQAFRRHGAALVLLAVISLGLIGWFQAFPTAVPERVSAKLAALDDGLQQQASLDALNANALLQQQSALTALNAADSSLQQDMIRLHAQDDQLAQQVGGLRDDQIRLKGDLEAMRSQVGDAVLSP